MKESTSDAVGLVEVFDKDTGKFLQDFKVEEEKQNNENNPLADYGISDYSLKNVSSTKAEGPSNELRSTLYAKLYIYSTGSFRQINEVRDTWWTTSSGGHTLENTQSGAISTSGSWPATEVEVDGNATIEVAIDASASASFEAAGFSVGVEAGGTYYARKDIWHDFRYSVY
ncbi:hypothetical protein [Lentibacillus salicampi]|uniref:Uncharacterized protein n=1 Tax=Lentibacillus salicampi TaxID=175306 RepID=A0A4Y9A9L4_9BACI|nr:hypothetical protein [Lentibacillus salicampi]TFJ91992.1 hypothetical protein E4U82_14635 [Lentibacillus salicampi]